MQHSTDFDNSGHSTLYEEIDDATDRNGTVKKNILNVDEGTLTDSKGNWVEPVYRISDYHNIFIIFWICARFWILIFPLWLHPDSEWHLTSILNDE